MFWHPKRSVELKETFGAIAQVQWRAVPLTAAVYSCVSYTWVQKGAIKM
jgi:hypothetical protein